MTDHRIKWEDAVQRLIDDPTQAELVKACYFDPPLAQAARRYHQSAEWQQVRTLLPPAPAVIVDIGAGNGIVSYALAQDGYTCIAIEPDPSMLVGAGAIRSLAAAENLNITVLEAFGEDLPLFQGQADAVIARQVMHHAAHLDRFAAELARIVRPGGAVITLRDHVIDDDKSLRAFLDRHPLHRLYGGENAFTLRQYEGAIQAAGLTITQRFQPFDGPINMAPYTWGTLRAELSARLKKVKPLGWIATPILRMMPNALLATLLNAVDRRPGRLFSYVCVKK